VALLRACEQTAASEHEQLEQESRDAMNPDHPANARQWSIEMRLAQARAADKAIRRRVRRHIQRPQGARAQTQRAPMIRARARGAGRPCARPTASASSSSSDSEGESEPPGYRRTTFLRRSSRPHVAAEFACQAVIA
jgi:hypothetical protein